MWQEEAVVDTRMEKQAGLAMRLGSSVKRASGRCLSLSLRRLGLTLGVMEGLEVQVQLTGGIVLGGKQI